MFFDLPLRSCFVDGSTIDFKRSGCQARPLRGLAAACLLRNPSGPVVDFSVTQLIPMCSSLSKRQETQIGSGSPSSLFALAVFCISVRWPSRRSFLQQTTFSWNQQNAHVSYAFICSQGCSVAGWYVSTNPRGSIPNPRHQLTREFLFVVMNSTNVAHCSILFGLAGGVESKPKPCNLRLVSTTIQSTQ